MIQYEKHSSLESPPDLPFFKNKNKNKCENTSNSRQSQPSPIPTASISPSERVALRSECMKQLDTWHSLFEKGTINKEQ